MEEHGRAWKRYTGLSGAGSDGRRGSRMVIRWLSESREAPPHSPRMIGGDSAAASLALAWAAAGSAASLGRWPHCMSQIAGMLAGKWGDEKYAWLLTDGP